MYPRASIRPAALAVALLAISGFSPLLGQRIERIPESLIRTVMPTADRLGEVAGDPPVVTGFAVSPDGSEVVTGYVFLTSDLPPEQFGYSGPIEALVGMRPDGTLTGMRVTDYNESYMRSMGDFLRTPGFQEQFAGKHIGDPFQVWNDVEGISRVSISVRALSRGVRDAARRIANAYALVDGPSVATSEVVDPIGLSWFELRQSGIVQRFEVTEPGEGSAGIGLAFIQNDRLGAYFLGAQLYERAQRSAERRGGADNLMLYTIDGSRLRLFRQQGWSIEQDGDTTAIDPRNVISMGLPSGGIVSGEATMVGIMLPSTTLTYFDTRWGHRNRTRRGVRAFKQGMAPVVVGLLIATGWVLAAGNHVGDAPALHLWLLTGVAALVVWRTRIHLLWLLGAGAVLGAIGFV